YLRQHTEAYFYAFVQLWQRKSCQDPTTQVYSGLDQRPCVSVMNGISQSSCSVRTEDELWHFATPVRPDCVWIDIQY
ncbi:hypothetical protein Golomagni_00857, partial [Golovinomyces magnicellulatus]